MEDFFKFRLKDGRIVPLLSYAEMLGVSFLFSVFAPFFVLVISPLLALLYLLPFWGIRAYYKGQDATFSLLSMIFFFFWVVTLLLAGVAGVREPYNPIWMVYSLLLLFAPFLLAYFSMDERADWTTYIKLSSCFSGYFLFWGLFLLVYEFAKA
ncbi:MAG: hypothetical protein J5554_07740 [Paludibacteraceae bacterium]|nr:hypothetical protein [Paludibacteraceae bacterium]